MIWLLEAFDRRSGDFSDRHLLHGLSNEDVAAILGLDDVGHGDLFDMPAEAVERLAKRYGFGVDLEGFDYLIGRGAFP